MVMLACVIAIAGCGGSAPATATYVPTTAHIPSCAHARKALPLPAKLPKSFPILKGTAITYVQTIPGGVHIEGYVPVTSFDGTVRDMTNAMSAAGLTAAEQDAEPPIEAEALEGGADYVVQWKLHNISGCSGALTLDALVTRNR